jgi:hypothetical protein
LEGTAVEHAVAYLDLGTGSVITQVIIASILTVPFFLRTQIRRATTSLRTRLGRRAADPDESVHSR